MQPSKLAIHEVNQNETILIELSETTVVVQASITSFAEPNSLVVLAFPSGDFYTVYIEELGTLETAFGPEWASDETLEAWLDEFAQAVSTPAGEAHLFTFDELCRLSGLLSAAMHPDTSAWAHHVNDLYRRGEG